MRTGVATFAVLVMVGRLLAADIPQFGVFEGSFTATTDGNALVAAAVFNGPSGLQKAQPLFWNGEKQWVVRFSPGAIGEWTWTIESNDPRLSGKTGAFRCVAPLAKSVSALAGHGGVRASTKYPFHFEYEDGTPFYLFGDTQWRLYLNEAAEKLTRAAVLHYIDVRASQGFNWIHSWLAEKSIPSNDGGPMLNGTTPNPAFFTEMDSRVKYLNDKGITACLLLFREGGQAILKTNEGCIAFAKYIITRYGAYNTAFAIGNEWSGGAALLGQIGEELKKNNANNRLLMSQSPGLCKYPWASVSTYEQSYSALHKSILSARNGCARPAINSEYGYFLRDQDGDGKPDKGNSTSVDAMRAATWDIVTAGGYMLTGFGTTYYGGNRDPGPFNVDAASMDPWEAQIVHVKEVMTGMEWWRMQPSDALVTKAPAAITGDVSELGQIRPPLNMYAALAEPGRQYLLYCRGMSGSFTLSLGGAPSATYGLKRVEVISGTSSALSNYTGVGPVTLSAPDSKDYVFILRNTAGGPAELPTVSISADKLTVKPGEEVTFAVTAAAPAGSIASHEWNWAGTRQQLTGAPAPTVKHTFAQAGSYDVNLKVTDNASSPQSATSNTLKIIVTDNLPPKFVKVLYELKGHLDITSPNNRTEIDVPVGSTLEFYAVAEDPEKAQLTYSWDFEGDGTLDANGQRVEHTFSEGAMVSGIVRASDGVGYSEQRFGLNVETGTVALPGTRPTWAANLHVTSSDKDGSVTIWYTVSGDPGMSLGIFRLDGTLVCKVPVARTPGRHTYSWKGVRHGRPAAGTGRYLIAYRDSQSTSVAEAFFAGF